MCMEGDKRQNNRAVGSKYEHYAGEYLTGLGYKILEFNYRCRSGEIDIIAQDGDCIVFCEVKYRKSGGQGDPLEAVGKRKQERIAGCAKRYLMTNKITGVPCRFDVVGILGSEVTHIKNAFFAQ